MTPASVLVGLGAAPLWAAMRSYLTALAGRFAEIEGTKQPDEVARFFGIFYSILHICRFGKFKKNFGLYGKI